MIGLCAVMRLARFSAARAEVLTFPRSASDTVHDDAVHLWTTRHHLYSRK